MALAPGQPRAEQEPLAVIATSISTLQVTGWLAAQHSEPVKRLAALHWWDEWQRSGNSAALAGLPYLLELDCAFFLQVRWIAELLARWRRTGAVDKINRVFFGTPKRGVRSFPTTIQNEKRDLKVCVAVEQRKKKLPLADAFSIVAAKSFKLCRETLSPENVRRIYEYRRRGDTPLEGLLSPSVTYRKR
jgi:hypothetical protein